MLERLLKEYNSEQVVGDPVVREKVIAYLDSHDYPHSIQLDFLKMITKVGHSILKHDEHAMTPDQVSKLISYSLIATSMLDNLPPEKKTKKYANMHSHLYSHLGQLYLIQFNNLDDEKLLVLAFESDRKSAELSRSDELQTAFHSYKRCSEYSKSLYGISGDLQYLIDATVALEGALETSEEIGDRAKRSYAVFHLGEIYTHLFRETEKQKYAKQAHQYNTRLIKDDTLNGSKKTIKDEIFLCQKMYKLTRKNKWKRKERSFKRVLYPDNKYYSARKY